MKRIISLIIFILIACMLFCGCEEEDKRSRKKDKVSTHTLSDETINNEDEINDENDIYHGTETETEEYTEEPQEEEVDYQLYKLYINNAIDEHQEVNSYSSAQGVLYDIDSNGVDELIIAHHMSGSSVPKCVYSIFTIKNNRVYELLDKELFFNLAGGPSGTVIAMKGSDDENLIAFRYDEVNPGNNGEMNHHGTWQIYNLDSIDIEIYKLVSYSYVTESYNSNSILYDKSTAKVSYQEISYKEFEDWLSEYYCKDLFDTNGNKSGNSLERLLIDLS